MRFHLIDRIDSWDSDVSITARKVTSTAEDYWRRDHTGRLLMPPELILESVCQSVTWLIMLSSGFTQRAVLLSVGELLCSGEAEPGDVLTVSATIMSRTGDAALADGRVDIDGHPVLRSTGIMCALRDAETLDAQHTSERMARLLLRTEQQR